MEISELKHVIEAALLASGRPLSLDELRGLFGSGDEAPSKSELREAVTGLQGDYEGRGLEVAEVASGYRVQIRSSMAPWLAKLWEIRPPRYSRALLETLAIIAYRQPVTRGDVEEVRGVSVTANIIRTLLERGWIRVVGLRDVPGKPEMFGTTREFLDYFGLKTLDELPELEELRDIDSFSVQLQFPDSLPDELTSAVTESTSPEALEPGSDNPGEGVAADSAMAETAVAEAVVEDEPQSATVVPLKAR